MSSVRSRIVDGMTNLFDDHPWHEYDDEYDDLDFDDREFERPRLTLPLEQQAALSAALAQLRSCDGTLRGAQRWARSAGVPWPRLRRELRKYGGYCDCEAVVNVLGGDVGQVGDVGGADPD